MNIPRHTTTLFGLTVAIALLVTGCNATEENLETSFGVQYSQPEQITILTDRKFEALADIVDELLDEGAVVLPLYEINPQAPFANADAYRFSVNASVIDFYVYESDVIAQQAVDMISDDAEVINNLRMDWAGTPHFFYEDQVLALYLGSDPDIIRLLLSTMGPQAAGYDYASDRDIIIEDESMIIPESQ